MRPVDRRRFRLQLGLGALLTLLTMGADWAGLLSPLENLLYDVRCRHCQRFLRKPVPPVHVDIDPNAIDVLGRPGSWPRSSMAAIVDELYSAGAKVVALDVLFSESTTPTEDDALAKAFSHGQTVVAVNLDTTHNVGANADLGNRLRKLLTDGLEITADAAKARIATDGFRFDDWEGDFASEFIGARKEAMLRRIQSTMDAGIVDSKLVFAKVLPGIDLGRVSDSDPLIRLYQQQFELAVRVRQMLRFLWVSPVGAPSAYSGINRTPPILPLASAAAASGFTNYDSDADGGIRAIPLWIEVDGKLLPQLGLAAVLRMVGTPIDAVRLNADTVIIPRQAPEPDLIIPVHRHDFGRDKGVGYCINVAMFGKRNEWESMYDVPRFQESADHISVLGAYRIAETRERIRRNNEVVDQAISNALNITDAPAATDYLSLSPELRPRSDMIGETTKQIAEKLEELRAIPNPPAELARAIRALKEASGAIQSYPNLDRQLRGLLDDQRNALAGHVKGRTAFIGFAADGQDLVTTPIHQRCPGVVVHGAIYNAILSGELWSTVPRGYTLAMTFILGVLTTILVSRLWPPLALMAAVFGVSGYAAVNGFLLFDYGDLIVGAAGPISAIIVVWAGLTLTRFISEIGERNRITRRFKSYVDPSLVKYVIEHPELVRLDGEVRLMTVAFTDLVGFTTLTEQFGPKTVKVLSRYKGKMVPVIRKHRGFVHCFMGDGIMFSYGAPEPNPNHAADAVATVLEMQTVMEEFNREILAEGYPPLGLRAGVSTGNVIVGDSGSEDACDYAALGDATNLGARLESANKATGTKCLISERTAELLEGKYLLRPIARLVVAGKTQLVMTYEPMGLTETATPEQRELASLTNAMVEDYVASRFDACTSAAAKLDERYGESKLTRLYREACRQQFAEPSADFQGQIALKEK